MFLAPLVAVALSVPVPPPGLVGRVGSPPFRSPLDGQLLGVSADGRRVYTSSYPVGIRTRPVVYAWDARTGALFASNAYGEPGDNIHPVRLGPDGLRVPVTLFSTGAHLVRLVDPDTGRTLSSTPPYLAPPVTQVDRAPPITHRVFGPGGWMYTDVDKVLQLVYGPTGRVIDLGVPPKAIADMGFADDGKTFFLMPRDEPVRLYELPSGKLAELPKPDGANEEAYFTPDGKALAVWTKRPGGFALDLWDVATKQRRPVLGGRSVPGRFVIAPDGKTFAHLPIRVGAYNPAGDWEVCSLADGRVLARFPSEPYSGHAAFSPDSKTLYLQTGDRTVVPWDVATGTPAAQATDPPGEISRFRFTADGKIVALVASGVSTFGPDGGKELSRVRLPRTPDYFYGVRFDAAGDRVAFVDFASNLTTWEWRTGKETKQRIPPPAFNSAPGEVFTPDGAFQVSGEGNFTARDVRTGETTTRPFPAEWTPPGRRTPSIAWQVASPDGRRIAVASVPETVDREPSRGAVVVFDARGTAPPRAVALTDFPVTSLAFSPDGRMLVAGGASEKVSLRVFDAATLRTVAAVPNFGANPNALVFSPDGRVVALSCAYHEVRLFETATWRERVVLPSPGRVHTYGWSADYHRDLIAFSPDGRRIATATPGGGLLVWDARKLGPTPQRPASLDGAWADLLGEDARRAHAAVGAFAAFPDVSLPFLKSKLPPAPGPDAKAIAALVAQLDADDFAEREGATKALAASGRHAEAALRAALAKSESAEVRKRLAGLLARLTVELPTADERRAIRAVEAVEWVGTPAAKELLKSWAGGAPAATLTRDATAALARLN
jgi:WD40 repeat protein